ncbi:MAG: hypothetical protein IIY93_12295 [Clostridia bacterium]|nr:hypothetical protein [Clostridia bacterium]MBQ1553864.1 hypothetical protein [Clostridia bacterium]MBQ4397951.1 hypothetical protein [Clostridia bacterium]
MKMTNDRAAFYGTLGETIDIYQVEHVVAAAFHQLGGRVSIRGSRQRVVVGHDTNPASDMMEAAVCAALCAAGADVLALGTVPSGAVSYLTARCEALMGVMVTGGSFDYDAAGLKFYRSNGKPVTGELLQSIHAAIDSQTVLSSKQAGRILRADNRVLNMYRHHLLSASNFTIFEKLKVAIDCVDSATEAFAKDLLEQMGIDVAVYERDDELSDKPYQKSAAISEFVKDTHSSLGFTFNVNGEICLAADAEGKLLDTEKLAAIFGRVLGAVKHEDTTPQTVMVSQSCHVALAPYIKSMGAECRVVTGDYSYLAEEFENFDAASEEGQGVLMAVDRDAGLIFPRVSAVPDGLLTAVMTLTCLHRTGLTLVELSREIPKLIRNTCMVHIPSGASLPTLNTTDLPDQIKMLRSYLSGDGRVVLTRPERSKIEIIVEGIDARQVESVTGQTERFVRKSLQEKNGPIYETMPVEKKAPPADSSSADVPAKEPMPS